MSRRKDGGAVFCPLGKKIKKCIKSLIKGKQKKTFFFNKTFIVIHIFVPNAYNTTYIIIK